MTTQLDDRTTPLVPPGDPATPLAVRATALTLDGRRGRVYGPVDLAIGAGSLTLVTGHAGSGRTSLLLTLTGRLRPNRGSDLTVLGRPLPRRAASVQRRSSAVGINGLDDLDDEVSVAATVRERRAWLAPWYRIVRTPTDEEISELCRPVFGPDPTPPARALVHSLDEADNLRLRIALAWLSHPKLLVVDDIDALHDTEGRLRVWQSLRHLAAQGTTVVVAASSPAELRRLDWDVLPTHLAL